MSKTVTRLQSQKVTFTVTLNHDLIRTIGQLQHNNYYIGK